MKLVLSVTSITTILVELFQMVCGYVTSYILDLNILAIYCLSVTTSKMGLDFWYNKFVYELPHELPNALILKT